MSNTLTTTALFIIAFLMLTTLGCDQGNNMLKPLMDEVEPDPAPEEVVEAPSEAEMVEVPSNEEKPDQIPPEEDVVKVLSEEEALEEATKIALQMEESRLVLVANFRAEMEEAAQKAAEEGIPLRPLVDEVYKRFKENLDELIQETCGITEQQLRALLQIHFAESPKGEDFSVSNGDKRADINAAWVPPIALEYLRLKILNPNSTYEELKVLFLSSVRNDRTTAKPL